MLPVQNAALTPRAVKASAVDIDQIFNRLFKHTLQTALLGGASEPLYQPAGEQQVYHTIYYSHDYVSSALHEIAHWCIAGVKRRQCADYGYWYAPDGRSPAQQAEFELVEVKPQALERILSCACGVAFRLSADNLGLQAGPSEEFKYKVHEQTLTYVRQGLPEDAATLIHKLIDVFQFIPNYRHPLQIASYSFEELK